jgi:hypothetical protein
MIDEEDEEEERSREKGGSFIITFDTTQMEDTGVLQVQ